MKTFELIPHTADLLDELFRNALEGMSEIRKHDAIKWPFDSSILLIGFLNKLLIIDLVKNLTLYHIVAIARDKTRLSAIVQGMRVKVFNEEVRAVIYHSAGITRNAKGNHEDMMVFDI